MSFSASIKNFFHLPDFTRKPVFKFISKRIGPFTGTVTLDRNRVYILPTKTGMMFLLLLLLLLLGSMNYSKSLGFVLTFILVGLGNIAMFSIWKNLAGLKLRAGGCSPVFVGEKAVFAVQLENPDEQTRYSIAIVHQGQEYEVVDVPTDTIVLAHFEMETKQRGYLEAGRFRLHTEFPMGLFIAWTWIDLSMECLVYPKPARKAEMVIASSQEDGEQAVPGAGVEEFAGLRKYQSGDSWRRVAWKAVARSADPVYGDLLVKKFTGGCPELLWIDWWALAVSDTEARLSTMVKLIIDAEQAGRCYGLRMPEKKIEPGHGYVHCAQCLKVLALYER